MSKEEDRLIAVILLLCICAVAFIWAAQERSERQAAERAAMEASYGETPKPEGHGL